MERLSRKLRDEKGIALPFVAVTLLAIVALTAVGVETGRLATVATEVQTAADIAATAGARQLFADPMANPRLDAEEVLSGNRIDGALVSGAQLTQLQVGNYTSEAGFVSNLAPFNAVRAQVEYTVDNIMLAVLGTPTTHVTKVAVARFAPAAGGMPTIPIAVGDCLFQEGCMEESCLPTLTQVPSLGDNSAWTGYSVGASTSTISVFFPAECEGDPSSTPLVKVGDFISLINGQSVPLLKKIECMMDHNITEVLLPVVRCGTQINQAREVVGFARFKVLAVRSSGGNKGIDVRGLMSAMDGPGGEGESFGAGIITMVQ